MGYETREAFRMACYLLGLDQDAMEPYVDAWLRPCVDRFRFKLAYEIGVRIERVTWCVDIDHDADGHPGGGGWTDLSKATRVEVTLGW
jgi:hypothetical protein